MQKTILVLDENSMIHGLIETAVSMSKIELHVFHEENYELFFDKTKEVRPDLIFMSNQEEKRNYEITQQIIKEVSDTPLILLTSAKDKIDEIQISNLGVKGYIRKPFEYKRLQNQIREVFGNGFFDDLQENSNQSNLYEDSEKPIKNLQFIDNDLLDLMSQEKSEPEEKDLTIDDLESELEPTKELESMSDTDVEEKNEVSKEEENPFESIDDNSNDQNDETDLELPSSTESQETDEVFTNQEDSQNGMPLETSNLEDLNTEEDLVEISIESDFKGEDLIDVSLEPDFKEEENIEVRLGSNPEEEEVVKINLEPDTLEDNIDEVDIALDITGNDSIEINLEENSEEEILQTKQKSALSDRIQEIDNSDSAPEELNVLEATPVQEILTENQNHSDFDEEENLDNSIVNELDISDVVLDVEEELAVDEVRIDEVTSIDSDTNQEEETENESDESEYSIEDDIDLVAIDDEVSLEIQLEDELETDDEDFDEETSLEIPLNDEQETDEDDSLEVDLGKNVDFSEGSSLDETDATETNLETKSELDTNKESQDLEEKKSNFYQDPLTPSEENDEYKFSDMEDELSFEEESNEKTESTQPASIQKTVGLKQVIKAHHILSDKIESERPIIENEILLSDVPLEDPLLEETQSEPHVDEDVGEELIEDAAMPEVTSEVFSLKDLHIDNDETEDKDIEQSNTQEEENFLYLEDDQIEIRDEDLYVKVNIQEGEILTENEMDPFPDLGHETEDQIIFQPKENESTSIPEINDSIDTPQDDGEISNEEDQLDLDQIDEPIVASDEALLDDEVVEESDLAEFLKDDLEDTTETVEVQNLNEDEMDLIKSVEEMEALDVVLPEQEKFDREKISLEESEQEKTGFSKHDEESSTEESVDEINLASLGHLSDDEILEKMEPLNTIDFENSDEDQIDLDEIQPLSPDPEGDEAFSSEEITFSDEGEKKSTFQENTTTDHLDSNQKTKQTSPEEDLSSGIDILGDKEYLKKLSKKPILMGTSNTDSEIQSLLNSEIRKRLGEVIGEVISETVQSTIQELLPEMMNKIIKEELENK